ncbi:hypothetical protein [Paraburkholderia atlantica]|uniref:hypothetical protein n=1 Tax=Paraburkholderia atlantica TaxID=2654982 RepID=UPI0012FED977|nr:hypothetical protein [Paraburkholderia atlantica]
MESSVVAVSHRDKGFRFTAEQARIGASPVPIPFRKQSIVQRHRPEVIGVDINVSASISL